MVVPHFVLPAHPRERLRVTGRRWGSKDESFLDALELGARLPEAHPARLCLVAGEPGILDGVTNSALAVNRKQVRIPVVAVHLALVEHADAVAQCPVGSDVDPGASLAHGWVLHEVPPPSEAVAVNGRIQPLLLDRVESALEAAL